tara:strand:+ start:1652 stop:2032 length:381 start_codon:yes stop_codon:yes gene_type:complete
MTRFVKISEVSKILNLVDPKTNKPLNYILRYWEKQFTDIKPKKINNQRYYSLKQVEKLKTIQYLLKKEGMSIMGVKNFLKLNTKELDDSNDVSLKSEILNKQLKSKVIKLLQKIRKMKNYGKKISS